MTISIITPTHRIISATDIGIIKAAISISKAWNCKELNYVHMDNANRKASVVKWERWNGRIITIKNPAANRASNN